MRNLHELTLNRGRSCSPLPAGFVLPVTRVLKQLGVSPDIVGLDSITVVVEAVKAARVPFSILKMSEQYKQMLEIVWRLALSTELLHSLQVSAQVLYHSLPCPRIHLLSLGQCFRVSVKALGDRLYALLVLPIDPAQDSL